MKRRKFLSSLYITGGMLAVPSILTSCKKELSIFPQGKNELESKILGLNDSNQLESKFERARNIYENTHGIWDCTIIRIVSQVSRTPNIKSAVTKKFGCNTTNDFLIKGTFLKETASKFALKLPKVQISGQSYYINIYDKPVAISLPVSGVKKLRRPLYYGKHDKWLNNYTKVIEDEWI